MGAHDIITTKSPFLIALRERNNNKNSNNKNITSSPLSGSEPKYEPARWNDKKHIKYNHNCYAYVLNKIASNRDGKPQPGYFSNFPPLRRSDYKCEVFFQRLKKDIPSMYKISFGKPCRKGSYKGFIAIDPKKEDQDYHFYRQDSNGYWSHKPGRNKATNLDADGNKIKNPVYANRKYEYFDYSDPCFFFCVYSKLSGTRSRSTKDV